MSNEELEYINSLNAKRREQLCRREWMLRNALQWGGWLLAVLVLLLNIAVRAS